MKRGGTSGDERGARTGLIPEAVLVFQKEDAADVTGAFFIHIDVVADEADAHHLVLIVVASTGFADDGDGVGKIDGHRERSAIGESIL